jgi:NAD(P)H dehydrogenase (quinone)
MDVSPFFKKKSTFHFRPTFYFIGLIFAVLSFKVYEFGYQRLPYRAVGYRKVWAGSSKCLNGGSMNVLIMYYSKGGNTRKLAEAIAEGVGQVDGVEAVLRHTRDVSKDDFVAADGLIVGSPVYFGTMAAQLKQVLDEFVGVRKKMENKVGAAFSTSGDASGGKETTMMSIIQALLIYGMIIVGDPMSATGHYGTACVGVPDAAVQENGRKLGRRVAELVKRLRR